MYYKSIIFVFAATFIAFASTQSYEDKRCKCVCPSPAAVLNNSVSSDRKLYIANVPPNKCNCDGVILPRVGEAIKGREQEFCPRCECKYENRNTTIIKVVVIIVIWVITLLVVYMGFLICLDPLINKRAKASYQEHTNEDDEGSVSAGTSQPLGARGNVLNRVTHQQDKWKRQSGGK
ncbi:TMEM9 domain-containing protein [Phthorimaea operculella]|nr:TMEM9 domain-containing protein [Phthorimaea operculella]